MLIEEGDNVLCESFTYSGSLATLNPLQCNLVGQYTLSHVLPHSHPPYVLSGSSFLFLSWF